MNKNGLFAVIMCVCLTSALEAAGREGTRINVENLFNELARTARARAAWTASQKAGDYEYGTLLTSLQESINGEAATEPRNQFEINQLRRTQQLEGRKNGWDTDAVEFIKKKLSEARPHIITYAEQWPEQAPWNQR